jgi:dUTPase
MEKINMSQIMKLVPKVHKNFMLLHIFIDNDPTLKNLYLEAVEKHNQKLAEDPIYYDAGFDLFLPDNSTMVAKLSDDGHIRPFNFISMSSIIQNNYFMNDFINKVDFKVKCSAVIVEQANSDWICQPTPFYTYARSSLSKTPLRLANNQGIIDTGYRGNLIGMFDCLSDTYSPEPNSRLLQICAPGLLPIYVNVVDNIEDLGASTARGEGGFGSTGK